MNSAAIVFFVSLGTAHSLAQTEAIPSVITQMEELGTVYLTRSVPKGANPASKTEAKKGAIIGVDFRPTAGTDPKKVTAAVKELSTLPELESVLLLGQDVTDEAADALPTSAKLISVQFFRTQVGDKGIAKLTRLRNLQIFKYTGMNISDEGMKELAKIQSLHTIEITDSKITDQGVLALRILPSLISLTIENTAATQQSIDQLQQRLPRIEGRRTLR
jgi:hypothetical protein